MSRKDEAIEDAAAQWAARLGSDQCTRADEEAARSWINKDPAHARAYAQYMGLWDAVGDLVATDEAHQILKPLRSPVLVRRKISRRILLSGGLAAALAVATAVVAPLWLHGAGTLMTAPGEQRRVQLPDGTGVLLNTNTQLRVKFVDAERAVMLDRGQALFEVAKDKKRPFRVFVGSDEVRALGTAFEVRRIGNGVQVTLEEGRVAIYHSDSAPSQPQALPPVTSGTSVVVGSSTPVAILAPGEQAVVQRGDVVLVHTVDLKKTQAWRYGRMILDDVLLGDAVADLNRYGGVQIVLADPKLAAIRVSGVFHTGRPEDFAESIVAAFPVDIARQDDSAIVLKPR
jgi:transmembrane sensor